MCLLSTSCSNPLPVQLNALLTGFLFAKYGFHPTTLPLAIQKTVRNLPTEIEVFEIPRIPFANFAVLSVNCCFFSFPNIAITPITRVVNNRRTVSYGAFHLGTATFVQAPNWPMNFKICNPNPKNMSEKNLAALHGLSRPLISM